MGRGNEYSVNSAWLIGQPHVQKQPFKFSPYTQQFPMGLTEVINKRIKM